MAPFHFLKLTGDRTSLRNHRLETMETAPRVTVLRELGGAGERGELEAVFSHRNHPRMVELLPRLLLLLLHLSPSRWQGEINLCILRLLHIHLGNS